VASSEAPYAHVKRALKDGLARGRWPPGARMPSESQLVARFGVSRMTVHRALRELQTEGFVDRRQGVGSFAAAPRRIAATLTIRDLHDEIVARGGRASADVRLARSERTGAALAARLGVATGARVFHTQIVHRCDGVALQCEDRYVNPAAAPGYLQVDFTRTTPTHYLLEVAPTWHAQYSIEAATPTAEEARWLEVDPKAPCLIVVRRTESRGVPVTLARLVHPGERYAIAGEFGP
jgi:GntR family transcriptional regulator, histidine utilization repressor